MVSGAVSDQIGLMVTLLLENYVARYLTVVYLTISQKIYRRIYMGGIEQMYGHKFFNRGVVSALGLAVLVSTAFLMPVAPSLPSMAGLVWL